MDAPYSPASATPLHWYGQPLEQRTTLSGQKSGRMWLRLNRFDHPELYRKLLATELFELLVPDDNGLVDLVDSAQRVQDAPSSVHQLFRHVLSNKDGPSGKVCLDEWLKSLRGPEFACIDDVEFESQQLTMQVPCSSRHCATALSYARYPYLHFALPFVSGVPQKPLDVRRWRSLIVSEYEGNFTERCCFVESSHPGTINRCFKFMWA